MSAGPFSPASCHAAVILSLLMIQLVLGQDTGGVSLRKVTRTGRARTLSRSVPEVFLRPTEIPAVQSSVPELFLRPTKIPAAQGSVPDMFLRPTKPPASQGSVPGVFLRPTKPPASQGSMPGAFLRPTKIPAAQGSVPGMFLRPTKPPASQGSVPGVFLRPTKLPASQGSVPGVFLRPTKIPGVPVENRGPASSQKQLNWITPSALSDDPFQPVTSDQEVGSYGKFAVASGVTVTFASRNFPEEYPPRMWTTWIFKPAEEDAIMQLSCDTYDLDRAGSVLLVTGRRGKDREIYRRDDDPPEARTVGKTIQLQLRTGPSGSGGGRLRCQVEATAPPPELSSGEGTPPVGLNRADCGRSSYSNRIVGGEPAPKNAYPWLVGLSRLSGKQPFCGGSLITERHVLTAAHCVVGRVAPVLNIEARKHNKTQDDDQITIRVKKITIHPDYGKKARHDSDLAILELTRSLRGAINLGEGRVGAICIPTASCGGGGGPECFTGRAMVLAGWGVLKQGTRLSPATVQHVQVPSLTKQQCRDDYEPDGYTITDNMICAGLEEGGKDTCQGDSGGPMMLYDSNNIYTEVGIVSFGRGCARAGYPGVYTRVSEFYDWIAENSQL